MNAGLILGEVLVVFSMQALTPLFSVTKLVNAAYYQLGPDFQWPGERHDFWEVVYVDRGEAVITYEDFERINEKIEDADARYKNPRNLCSGSVRQLSSEITAQRNVRFYAFALVSAQEAAETGKTDRTGEAAGEAGTAEIGKAGAGEVEAAVDFENSRKKQFAFLASQGFDVVEYREVDAGNVEEAVSDFEERIRTFPIPSDGLVLIYDDIAYGLSLGTTAKFPRDSIAFKWEDETAETTLLEMEWSASRTGLINPVAIFEPVQLEGTTVSRASVHNVTKRLFTPKLFTE